MALRLFTVTVAFFSVCSGATLIAAILDGTLGKEVSLGAILGIWVAIFAVLALWIGIGEHRERRILRRQPLRTLQAGRVRESRIVASEVVELEEEDDEGPTYAFQLADDRIVFVLGQEFYPTKDFPNCDFALVDVLDPAGRHVDSFKKHYGERLEPKRRIPASLKRRLWPPEQLEVIVGRLEDFELLMAED